MKNEFKKMLVENAKPLIGGWITLGHPSIAEIMANSPFDWVGIDLEHSSISFDQCEMLIRTIDLKGKQAMVRLTNNDPALAKRIMDMGAHGIIVPMVNSAEEAKLAVSSIKYPPEGVRGLGLARAQKFGPGLNDYLEWNNKNSVVIIQIEHIDAVNKIEEIINVTGVDGLFLGPFDLSSSMNLHGQFNHPDFLNAVKRVVLAATKANKTLGTHIIEANPQDLKSKIDQGFNFLAYSSDVRMLDQLCRSPF